MNRKYGIGAVTKGANHWEPRKRTDWQRQRRDGPIEPMQYPLRSWLGRLWGK